MVVEPDEADCAHLTALLEARGWQVAGCGDGESAWARYREEPAGVLMVDVALPEVGAPELVRRVRDSSRDGGPVIVAVADGVDGRLAEVLAAGADDFVVRPVQADVLDARLVVARRRLRELRERAADAAAVARTADELSRRNRELTALHAIAQASLQAPDPETGFARILESVGDVLGVPFAAVQELDRPRDRLVTTAVRGVEPPRGPGIVPVAAARSGTAVRTERPQVESDPGELADGPATPFGVDGLSFFAALPMLTLGEVVGVLVLGSDVRVPWSARRTRLAARLADSVALYVEHVGAEETLRQNEAVYRSLAEELRQANQELEAFAYSISHDLRAPLRTMTGFAHTLLEDYGDALPDRGRDYAERIIASGKRSEQLIVDLLAYSRLSSKEVQTRPVELDGVVAAAREQVQAFLEEAGARLDVETGLPSVLGHHATLVQVVANLLGNAAKFVPDGRTPEIRVRGEDRGREFRLWVEDNGIGIPGDRRERIFKVFERLGEADRPGTGIGLAIVRRGMQRMGGSSGVEARPEGGSAFWIEIPRERGERRSWKRWRRHRSHPG